jgi:hypothetical protein
VDVNEVTGGRSSTSQVYELYPPPPPEVRMTVSTLPASSTAVTVTLWIEAGVVGKYGRGVPARSGKVYLTTTYPRK